jgi:hypothetical protein
MAIDAGTALIVPEEMTAEGILTTLGEMATVRTQARIQVLETTERASEPVEAREDSTGLTKRHP